MSPEKVIDLARSLLALVLNLVPHEVANQLLTDEAVKRQNLVADAAEAGKFG